MLLSIAIFLLYITAAQKLWKSKMVMVHKVVLEVVLFMVASIVIGLTMGYNR